MSKRNLGKIILSSLALLMVGGLCKASVPAVGGAVPVAVADGIRGGKKEAYTNSKNLVLPDELNDFGINVPGTAGQSWDVRTNYSGGYPSGYYTKGGIFTMPSSGYAITDYSELTNFYNYVVGQFGNHLQYGYVALMFNYVKPGTGLSTAPTVNDIKYDSQFSFSVGSTSKTAYLLSLTDFKGIFSATSINDQGVVLDLFGDGKGGGTYSFPAGQRIGVKYAFVNHENTLTDGSTKSLYYYVPNVPTIADILGGISAKDLFGADVAVDCSDVERGKYTAKIGLSTVKITATDQYGQTATATINIHIIDNGKPVIQLAAGKNLSFVADQGSLKVSELPSYFNITDVGTNYGGTLGTVTYTYDGAAFTDQTFTSANFGQHTVTVNVADSSGNSATQSFALTVTDGTAPVITRRDSSQMSSVIKIGVSRTFALTKAEFLQIFKATDNVDGDLSASLGIDGNFIGNKVGSYSVKIKVADKSGNTGSATASVQVIADLPPVFILSDTLVLATTEQSLTTADMTSIVTNGILSNQTVSACSVNLGTYVGNENVPGDYTITYQATVAGTKAKRNENSSNDVVGSFTLRVSDTAVKDDSEKTGWWDNFCKGWNEFWQKLGNWFRGVFTKFKFDCYLTDDELEMRFPKKDTEDKTDTSSSA